VSATRLWAARAGRGVCWVVALAGLLGPVGSCASDAARQVGEACKVSDDCADDLECVQFDGDSPVCLPAPSTRTPKDRPCRLDTECSRDRTNFWPTEARCERGACVCDGADRDCGRGRTLSPDCLCVDDDG
jgi:hypothetical protein